jgi:hypothetical protein
MIVSNLMDRLLRFVATGARVYIILRIAGVAALLAYLFFRSS